MHLDGYINRIRSSRRLEKEMARNLEVLWLTGRLLLDHKTISDFRRDNSKTLKNVLRFFKEPNQFGESLLFAELRQEIPGIKV